MKPKTPTLPGMEAIVSTDGLPLFNQPAADQELIRPVRTDKHGQTWRVVKTPAGLEMQGYSKVFNRWMTTNQSNPIFYYDIMFK